MRQTKLLPVSRRSSQEKKSNINTKSNNGGAKNSGSKQSKITTFSVDAQPRPTPSLSVPSLSVPSLSAPSLSAPSLSAPIRVNEPDEVRGAGNPSKKCITVRIETHAFLIPFPEVVEGLSVSWLCDEASSRYCRRFGSKPYLTVCLRDGAMVDKDDPLSVFEGQTEVVCQVDSWHVVGAEERYKICCNNDDVAPISEIIGRLKLSETDKTLDFSDLVFESPVSLKASLKALKGHEKLQKLCLDQMLLGEADWSVVINSLGSLKSLRDLNLAASGLERQQVEQIAKLLSDLRGDESSICKSLRKLNISYNDLGDETAVSLASILGVCPNLFALDLENVGLVNPSPQLSAALKSSSVRELNLSRNKFADSVLSSLLSSLHNCSKLNLSAILADQRVESGFSEGLMKLATNSHARLQALDLSKNNFPKHCVFDVITALCAARQLHTISLTSLDCISDDVLVHFLKKNLDKLKKLDVGGAGLSKPMKLELIDIISDLFQGSIESFCCSGVDRIDGETLISQWQACKGASAFVRGPIGLRERYQFSLTSV